MAKRPLFATYRQGENRVTASILAVFERLDTGTLESLLGNLAEETSLTLVEFGVVRPEGPGTVPDAVISGSFRYLFEVKLREREIRKDQIRGHLAHLGGDSSANKRLFVLTPDGEPPQVLDEFADEPLTWLSFAKLNKAIHELIDGEGETLSERERYLLRELQALFQEEGLLSREDTVVVAARRAYGEYLKWSGYFCQPNRSFRAGLERIGFYKEGAIRREFPLILHRRDEVLWSPEEAGSLRRTGKPFDKELADLMDRLLAAGVRPQGGLNQVFLLSAPDAPETFKLDHEIKHVTGGRGSAWVMGQRYVAFDAVKQGPRTTEELAGTTITG